MERRKSKQFDGTDAPEGDSTVARSISSGGVPRGLLRREVSRAYTVVASAGDGAVSAASVDVLAVLLRLMEEQASNQPYIRSI